MKLPVKLLSQNGKKQCRKIWKAYRTVRFFHARKEKPMEQKAKEILLEKLEEMAEVTPDAFDDLQGYAVLCSAMAEMCNAITQKA